MGSEHGLQTKEALFALLHLLCVRLNPCHCIFLSGDVHYGFTQSATFTILSEKGKYGKDKVRGGGGEANKDISLHISQLNSSALKTTSVAKEFILTEVLSRARQFFSFGRSVRIG